MAAADVWTVFFPTKCLSDSTSFLIGHVDEIKQSVYITDIVSNFINNKNSSVVGKFICWPIGLPKNMRPSPTFNFAKGHVWLEVYGSSADVKDCRLYRAGASEQSKCVTVQFDPENILSSLIFDEDTVNEIEFSGAVAFRHCCLMNVYKHSRPRSRLIKCAQQTSRNLGPQRHESRIVQETFEWSLGKLIMLFSFVDIFLGLASFKWCWSRVCVQTPAVVSHITVKLNRFRSVQSQLQTQPRSKLILFDACGQQFLDNLLGLVVMTLVMYSGCADTVAASVMNWADETASHLNDLLHWLMGAPAGLKLNSQLTQYMGHFFLYHVYLWSGYLSVLRPALGWVIWTAACFGILGLSTQLCLAQDIISMLTLHIYCFYVYAARLYSLQIYALSSLWRLFRGKKWNVLRLRVDSALYNIDQLCVGTLLFTVLLFLLPTLLLYYCVFTTLRLLVLTFHGLLTLMIDSINTIPAVTVLLHLLRSESVAGDLLFTVGNDSTFTQSGGNCVLLYLQTVLLPIQKLYCRAQTHLKIGQKQQEQYSWTELLQKVIFGRLIYPWVNPDNVNREEKLS